MNFFVFATEVGEYVTGLYNKLQTPELLYHNLLHTERVVNRTYEIAAFHRLGKGELGILVAAAWFHDTGQLFGKPALHEQRSVSVMKEFLAENSFAKNNIELIEGCIIATQIPQQPKSFLEGVICDADTYHFGTEEFLHTDDHLKNELEIRNNTRYHNWEKLTLNVLEKHRYFTPYCKFLLNNGKLKNIEIVRSRIGV